MDDPCYWIMGIPISKNELKKSARTLCDDKTMVSCVLAPESSDMKDSMGIFRAHHMGTDNEVALYACFSAKDEENEL